MASPERDSNENTSRWRLRRHTARQRDLIKERAAAALDDFFAREEFSVVDPEGVEVEVFTGPQILHDVDSKLPSELKEAKERIRHNPGANYGEKDLTTADDVERMQFARRASETVAEFWRPVTVEHTAEMQAHDARFSGKTDKRAGKNRKRNKVKDLLKKTKNWWTSVPSAPATTGTPPFRDTMAPPPSSERSITGEQKRSHVPRWLRRRGKGGGNPGK